MASAVYEHCVNVYKAMDAESIEEQVGTDNYVVWTGFLTSVFKQLELPVAYYSQVVTELKRIDSIRQLKRGGGTSKSKWILLRPPAEDLFETIRRPPGGKHGYSIIEQQIRDLQKLTISMRDQILLLEAKVEELENPTLG